MGEKGIVKFTCHWIKSASLPANSLKTINQWRDRLYRLGMIGAYEGNIGYGNISIRKAGSESFIISGHGTGTLASLDENHYAEVFHCDFETNTVSCKGPVTASSEALSHAAVYRSELSAHAVMHIHNRALWEKLKERIPTTSGKAEYGSREMAMEILRLFRESNVREKKVLVAGGDEEGLLTFGRDLEDAWNNLAVFLGDKGLFPDFPGEKTSSSSA